MFKFENLTKMTCCYVFIKDIYDLINVGNLYFISCCFKKDRVNKKDESLITSARVVKSFSLDLKDLCSPCLSALISLDWCFHYGGVMLGSPLNTSLGETHGWLNQTSHCKYTCSPERSYSLTTGCRSLNTSAYSL